MDGIAANQLNLNHLKEFCESVIMNIMEYGQAVWDIIGDIAAFIDVAKSGDSAPFTGCFSIQFNKF